MTLPVPALLRADDPEARRIVLDGLVAFNDAATGTTLDGGPLSAVLRDGADGPVLGGLLGHLYGSNLHLAFLYLPASLRGQGWGRRLVAMLEDEARRLGATGAHVETFSFQARGFYERLGYALYAEIPDYPPGHVRHALLKRFDAPPTTGDA